MSIADKAIWVIERNSERSLTLNAIANACGVSRSGLRPARPRYAQASQGSGLSERFSPCSPPAPAATERSGRAHPVPARSASRLIGAWKHLGENSGQTGSRHRRLTNPLAGATIGGSLNS